MCVRKREKEDEEDVEGKQRRERKKKAHSSFFAGFPDVIYYVWE